MTLYTNTFEGGTDETVITTGNSGGASGTPFDSLAGSPEFEAASAYHGAMGMILPSSSTQRQVRWDGLNNVTVRASAYVRFGSVAPSVVNEIIQFRTAGNAIVAGVALNTNGRVLIRVGAGGSFLTGTNISAHGISANTWYRIDVWITVDTTSTGRVVYRICNVDAGDTNTPITTAFDSGTTVNFGTTAIDRVHFGCMQAQARNGDWEYDTIRAEDGVAALFDLYTPPAPDITETFTDNLALLEASDGTPPFTIAQDSGTTTTPEELDDGAVSGTGRWLVAKHASDTLVYTVTDDAAVESDPYNVPPISPANSFIKRPTGSLPSTTWE